MTDSACVDSSSGVLTKCFWLLERFVRIATDDSNFDSSLMNSKYQLPNDYESNERPLYSTFEDLDLNLLNSLYKQSHLNS